MAQDLRTKLTLDHQIILTVIDAVDTFDAGSNIMSPDLFSPVTEYLVTLLSSHYWIT